MTQFTISVLVLLVFAKLSNTLPDVVRIGGLFHPADDKQEIVFKYAVEKINADGILPTSNLSAQIERVSTENSFQASKKVCQLLSGGLAAIFGPQQSAHTARHVQSICDAVDLPHLETRWDPDTSKGISVVNLYPHATRLSKAYADLVRAWHWKSFTVIYENSDGLVRLQELLKAHDPQKFSITVRQLEKGSDYRPLLKQIKKSAESHIVLDCSTDRVYDVLKQAQQVGLMSEYHSYILTSLDLDAVDLEEFKHGGTNITAFRLVDPHGPDVSKVVNEWDLGEAKISEVITSETALMYDAVHLFAKALKDLDSTQHIRITPLSCDQVNVWKHGFSLVSYMRTLEMKGLTGRIAFDNDGLRSDFVLDIVELSKDGLRKIGNWSTRAGIALTKSHEEMVEEVEHIMSKKNFIVTTRLTPPFVMRRESSETLTGNAQFEGYAVDLLHEISRILNFSYTIRVARDGSYGYFDSRTNTWNGMIGELVNKRADMAIGDITITSLRQQAVDFTVPFMSAGISILYKKPTMAPPDLFSFLSTLSADLLIYLAIASLGVSLLLFVLARLSPYEWNKPAHPCSSNPDVVENQFTLLNSLWFTVGSLTQQYSGVVPRAISTRIVAAMWWLFTLIMISSYTASLVAYHTVERVTDNSPIRNIHDLAAQTEIKYGVLQGGATASFFRESNYSTYQRMWNFMQSVRPSVFASTNSEGVERVLHSRANYAFLMESPYLEYVIARHCDLTQVGGFLDSRAYGIALPLNSRYRAQISTAILKLQEKGTLDRLKTLWWEEKRGGGQCSTMDDDAATSGLPEQLGLNQISGLFVILVMGMILACIVAVCELVWKSRKVALKQRSSFYKEMANELKFAVRFQESTKPIHTNDRL